MVTIGALLVRGRLVERQDIDPQIPEPVRPVSRARSDLDDRSEAPEGREGAVIGEDVRITLRQVCQRVRPLVAARGGVDQLLESAVVQQGMVLPARGPPR